VERKVRRSEQSRAVLCGQTWLLKTQKLALYCGVTYDVYEIFEQNEHGEWIPVEIGGVDSAETGRQQAREARKQEPKAAPKRARKAATDDGWTTPKPAHNRATARANSEVWKEVKQRSGAPKSALQQRIAEAKLRAYQIIADKKARGE